MHREIGARAEPDAARESDVTTNIKIRLFAQFITWSFVGAASARNHRFVHSGGSSQKDKIVHRQTGKSESREEYKSKRVGAAGVPDDAQHEWRKETAEPAEGAHQTRNRTGIPGKMLRHEFENGAIPKTQRGRRAQGADGE